MKHVITLQKRKGLYIKPGDAEHKQTALVHQLTHELMSKGFVPSKELSEMLETQTPEKLEKIHNQLATFFEKVMGSHGYEPIYRGFPQSVVNMSRFEFIINAIMHYWSMGTWRPEDSAHLKREFGLEAVNYTELKLLTKEEYKTIFSDILYSGSSINAFDKEILAWGINKGKVEVEFSKIPFKETKAIVGAEMLDSGMDKLPTKDATLVLRIYSAYSGGDEGLKENTKFDNPSNAQRRMLLNTLEGCYNLEESFKMYREKWLRLLFYLHPMTKVNRGKYPTVAGWAEKLRNNPDLLKTFNAYVEDGFNMKDPAVLDLMSKRPGVFTRRLDHAVRTFGYPAMEKWLELNLSVEQLVTAYNHFTDRDEVKGRGAVLANQSSSQVVTYEALSPLDSRLVKRITESIFNRLQGMKANSKKIFIDRALYYRPLATNNRASSLSITGKAVGTVELVPTDKTIRMYCHWDRKHDIDLSGLIITSDNEVIKVGWNAQHHQEGYVVYSGDNTGYADKNAEYLDINMQKVPSNVDWIITEARIYRGPSSFADWDGDVRAGWMERFKPEMNTHWMPETVEHAIKLESKAKTAYLCALHVPTGNLAYLDVAMGNAQVSGPEDALRMRQYLETIVTLDDGSNEIKWDRLNQGHVLHLLNEVVDDPREAEVVYDDNTTWEAVSSAIVAG